MKSKRSLLTCFLSVLVVALCIVGLTACGEKECNHQWGDWAVSTAVSCVDTGVQERKCTICGETEQSEIPALGHDWMSPSCTAPEKCSRCAQTRGEPLAHSYDQQIVKAEALKSAATCTDAAIYYRTCACGAVSTEAADTFTNGQPLAHTYDQKVVKDEALKSVGTCTSPAVYFKSCSCGAISTDDAYIFTNGEAVSHSFVLENAKPEALKSEATCSSPAVYFKSCSCGAISTDDAYIFTNGETLPHSFVLENVKSEALKSEATCSSPAVYFKSCSCGVVSTNDADTFKAGEVGAHSFTLDIVKAEALKSMATCTNPAMYYKSCACGAISTNDADVFTDGDMIGHSFTQEVVKQTALKSEATCTSPAIYYKSCYCGAVSSRSADTFTVGEALPHNFDQNVVKPEALRTAASCMNAAVYYKSCRCGAVSNNDVQTFADGQPLTHHFTEEIVKAETLKSKADCTNSAVYYKSCVCGVASTNDADTFTSGSALGHTYKLVSETKATCIAPETRTYRCDCGDEYTDKLGAALGHDIKDATATEELVEGCEYVLVYKCKTPGCGISIQGVHVYHHNYVASITKAATCKADGEKKLTCACGDTTTEVIPMNEMGHDWVKGQVVDGVRTDCCSVCAATKKVTVYEGTKTEKTNAENFKNSEVEINDANISLDDGVIDAIGDKNVTISAEKVDSKDLNLPLDQLEQVGDSPVYNFTINDGSNNIAQFGEGNYATITLPYTLAEGEDVDSIAVWFINEKGQVESIKATYNNGYVTFKTNHFSYYTVTRLTAAERCALYGHSYTKQVVSSSCTEDGYTLYTCVRCHDAYKADVVVAPGHEYEKATTEATCKEDGVTVYTCKNCKYAYTEKHNATGHNWNLKESTDSTCANNGMKTYICSKCQQTYSETLEKKPHEMEDTVVAATCEEQGYTLHKCKNCEYSYIDTYVEALGHAYKATGWEWTENYSGATLHFICEHDQSHTRSVNAEVKTETIRFVCTDYVKKIYTATVKMGEEVYSDSKVVESGKAEHQYAEQWKFNEKEHWRECACGEKTDITVHNYKNEKVTTEATCEEKGEKTAFCDCGATHVTTVGALGHVDSNGDNLCDRCGCSVGDGSNNKYVYKDQLISIPTSWNPHSYENSSQQYPLNWITMGFYKLIFNDEIHSVEGIDPYDGYVYVPEMAAGMPVDVTEQIRQHYPQFNIPGNATKGYAYVIDLNKNATWQDGTKITADDYIESMKRLLDPKLQNYRASDYFSDTFVLVGAEEYALQGRTIRFDNGATSMYTIADLVKGNDGNYTTPDGMPVCIAVDYAITWLGNNTLKQYVDAYGTTYFGLERWEELVALMDDDGLVPCNDETLAMLAATTTTRNWGETDADLPNYLIYDAKYGEFDFANVGLFKSGDYQITIVLKNALEGYKLFEKLTGNWLVKTDVYDACLEEKTLDDGTVIYISGYNTSVETTWSYGPYIMDGYQVGESMHFTKNANWYGYTDGEHVYKDPTDGTVYAMYQTTDIDCKAVRDYDTAKYLFMTGQLMMYDLRAEDLEAYAKSEYSYIAPGQASYFLMLNGNMKSIEEREADKHFDQMKYDLQMLTLTSFHRALGLAYDRQAFCDEFSPAQSPAFGLIGDAYIYDPDTGAKYRDSEQAKKVLCDVYGIDYTKFASLDAAVDTITGYDPVAAKEWFAKAYTEGIEKGYITDTDGDGKSDQTIKLTYALGGDTAASEKMQKIIKWLTDKANEAAKGTGLEGKIQYEVSAPLGNDWSTQIKAGMKDVVLVGWNGSVMDPFNLMEVYTNSSYQYDAQWFNAQGVNMTLTINGEEVTMNLYQWQKALVGTPVTVGEKTYNFGVGQVDQETRLTILAGLEETILSAYNYLPFYQSGTKHLLSKQVSYVTDKYSVIMGYGDIAYLRYNYTEAQWQAYVEAMGDKLECEYHAGKHYCNYTYELNGETCADGWTATGVCACGETIDVIQGKGHVTEFYQNIFLGDCGSFIREDRCIICGEIVLEYEGNKCNYGFVEINAEGYEVSKCSVCGLTRWHRYAEGEKNEQCQIEVTRSYVFFDAEGKEIFRGDRVSLGYIHNYEFSDVVGDCTNGWKATATCKDCGEVTTLESNGHWNAQETTTLSECGSSAWKTICQVCGQTKIGVNLNCQMQFEEINAEGYEVSKCSVCGLTEWYRYTKGEKNEQCQIEVTRSYVFFDAEGKEIFRGDRESLSYSHNYEFSDVVGDCTNGWKATVTCKDCGKMTTMEGNGHRNAQETTTLSECGSSAWKNICQICGQTKIGVNLNCQMQFEETNAEGYEVSKCSVCGLTEWYRYTRGEKNEQCQIEVTRSYVFFDAEGKEIFRGDSVSVRYDHDYEYSNVAGDCTNGWTATATCKVCSTVQQVSGRKHQYKSEDKTMGNCGSYIRSTCCQICGKNEYIDFSSNGCQMERKESVDGYTIQKCKKCGVEYRYRSDRGEDISECRYTVIVTHIVYNAAGEEIFRGEESYIEEAHDYQISTELINGSGSSCTDGVKVTRKCKVCGYEYEYTTRYHEVFAAETIELNSVCGGYAIIQKCACGAKGYLQLDKSLCDFGLQDIKPWVENVLTGYQETCDGRYYYDLYAKMYICSVSDPACAYKIRYQSYWLKDEDSCVAYQYAHWQLGYHEEDDSFDSEIIFVVSSRDYHNYQRTVTENGDVLTCTDCGSTLTTSDTYDENGNILKREWVYNHILSEGKSEYAQRIVEYLSKKDQYGIIHHLRTLESYKTIDVDGDEYWSKTVFSYSTNEDGYCWVVYTTTSSIGENYTNEGFGCSYQMTTREATCTQSGTECYQCVFCNHTFSNAMTQPKDHDWTQKYENMYECARCGLKNENGASGNVVLEDMTSAYGNSENYVAGYWVRDNAEFTKYVMLVLSDGQEVILEGIEFTEVQDLRAFAFSKAAVEAKAKELGYTGYEIRFVINTGNDLDYGLTF